MADLFNQTGVTDDEEIAHCLARIVAETPLKPNFEYRDFIPRGTGTLVAERHEPRYFEALLKVLSTGSETRGVAFLLDEFEEIGLNDTTRRRTAHHYVVTLKRLIDLTTHGLPELWVVIAMTPEAYRQTAIDVPAFSERMASAGAHITLREQTPRAGRTLNQGTPEERANRSGSEL